jgi:predicted transcriptional regulator of viral defense system
MKTDLLRPFENSPYFTLQGFKQATGMESPTQVRMLLSRWAKAGHILQLKKGVYMTRRFHDQHHGDPAFTAVVSAILLPQSYLSLDFILQEHQLLTEITYPTTSVTLKNTRKVTNRLGTFWYRHIRNDLYHGFTITEHYDIQVARASLAKALFDFLYLRPLPASARSLKIDLAEELRLNLDEVSPQDREEFANYTLESGSRKMMTILENFRRHVWPH